MNTKEFHQRTIRGLIQTTINRTLLDLERRQEIPLGTTIDWTRLRTLTNEINFLFEREVNSHRERIALENITTEIRLRAPTLNLTDKFLATLLRGVTAYSRYIKRNNLAPTSNNPRIQQTLEDQFRFGLLQTCQRRFQLIRLPRYFEYQHSITKIVRKFFT